jgi:hypothetical protein
MPFCNVTIDSSQSVRQTTIVSVDTMTPEGIVGVGELIELRVTFSDEVRFELDLIGFIICILICDIYIIYIYTYKRYNVIGIYIHIDLECLFETLNVAGASGYRGTDALHDIGQDGEFQVRIFEYSNDTYRTIAQRREIFKR